MTRFRLIGFFSVSGTEPWGSGPPDGPSRLRRLVTAALIALVASFSTSVATLQLRLVGSVTAIGRIGRTPQASPDPTVRHRSKPAAPDRSAGCLGAGALT
jgi:hypothetical protein